MIQININKNLPIKQAIIIVVVLLAFILIGSLLENRSTGSAITKSLCTDSDGGRNIYKRGTVTSQGRDYNDYCFNSSNIIETWCHKFVGLQFYGPIFCDYGCENGACRSTPITTITCTDTDNGINYAERGTVTSRDGSSTDSCIDGDTIAELYCDENNFRQVIFFGCEDGCNNGECGAISPLGLLKSKYFSRDNEILAIARGEKTITLPDTYDFGSRGVEWRIIHGLRLAGYELYGMPYGAIVNANKIQEFDNEIFKAEKIIYEKAEKFPFYKSVSAEDFKDNLPSEFGAYMLVSLFDLINSGDVKYQKYTEECLFATLYPKLPYLVNRGTDGSTPGTLNAFNAYRLPFKVQQGSLYGFDPELHNWNVDQNSYPETAIRSTYAIASGALHELVHELDYQFKDSIFMHEAYSRDTACTGKYMDFGYNSEDSPFGLKWNNGLSNEHFVSEYARFYAHEDAAESVTAYIFLPEYFRKRMEKSDVLRAKYNYIKDNIFGGVEFENPYLKGIEDFKFPRTTGHFYLLRFNKINKFVISDIKVK